ncbi:MAG: hypothetical protein U0T68_11595 [Ferruginibacter sp.]
MNIYKIVQTIGIPTTLSILSISNGCILIYFKFGFYNIDVFYYCTFEDLSIQFIKTILFCFLLLLALVQFIVNPILKELGKNTQKDLQIEVSNFLFEDFKGNYRFLSIFLYPLLLTCFIFSKLLNVVLIQENRYIFLFALVVTYILTSWVIFRIVKSIQNAYFFISKKDILRQSFLANKLYTIILAISLLFFMLFANISSCFNYLFNDKMSFNFETQKIKTSKDTLLIDMTSNYVFFYLQKDKENYIIKREGIKSYEFSFTIKKDRR